MKKIFVLLVISLSFVFLSCASNAYSKRANIYSQDISFSELSRDDYEVLGKVSGESTITENTLTKVITGDTLEYGYFGDIGYAGNISVNPLTQEPLIDVPKNPEDQARRNAIYKLIQAANILNADSVIFVKTLIDQKLEENKKVFHVIVSGIAIKIK